MRQIIDIRVLEDPDPEHPMIKAFMEKYPDTKRYTVLEVTTGEVGEDGQISTNLAEVEHRALPLVFALPMLAGEFGLMLETMNNAIQQDCRPNTPKIVTEVSAAVSQSIKDSKSLH